jgi:hypothetical protein
MKTFAELNVGDEFYSECNISSPELDAYLKFSGIKNIIYDDIKSDKEKRMVSGRAILSKMEGEFTRLEQMYGNVLIFYGIDGDVSWNSRQTRFLKPLNTDENLKIKFKISDKRELDETYGLIAIDFEVTNEDGKTVVISRKNLYQIKKDPPVRQRQA